MAEKCKKAKNRCDSDFEANRRARMLKQLRNHPHDQQTRDNYFAFYNKWPMGIQLTHQGRRRAAFRKGWRRLMRSQAHKDYMAAMGEEPQQDLDIALA